MDAIKLAGSGDRVALYWIPEELSQWVAQKMPPIRVEGRAVCGKVGEGSVWGGQGECCVCME